MHFLWGMMNNLQVISFMLKYNLTVPSNVYLFFKFINDFISMRAQFIDDWMDAVVENMLGAKDAVLGKITYN